MWDKNRKKTKWDKNDELSFYGKWDKNHGWEGVLNNFEYENMYDTICKSRYIRSYIIVVNTLLE